MADLRTLAIQAMCTPSLDAPGALEVLADALLEAGLIPEDEWPLWDSSFVYVARREGSRLMPARTHRENLLCRAYEWARDLFETDADLRMRIRDALWGTRPEPSYGLSFPRVLAPTERHLEVQMDLRHSICNVAPVDAETQAWVSRSDVQTVLRRVADEFSGVGIGRVGNGVRENAVTIAARFQNALERAFPGEAVYVRGIDIGAEA